MRLPRAGVDHGQDKRGASHRTPPMPCPVAIILCTCAPQVQLTGLDGTQGRGDHRQGNAAIQAGTSLTLGRST